MKTFPELPEMISLKKYVLVASITVIGCGRGEQKSAVVIEPSVTEKVPESATPVNPTAGMTRAPIPRLKVIVPVFEYPSDLGGKTVVHAVSPEPPALSPAERFGVSPRSRSVPAKILNPELTPKTHYVPPHIESVSFSSQTVVPPREPIPTDFGRSTDSFLPARPTLPIAAAMSERARDATAPPAMPTLGRRANERVSLEDPTSDVANAAIVAPPVNVPLTSAAFLKVTLPDPFELGEQIKPVVPPAAEPAAVPVIVDPRRVK